MFTIQIANFVNIMYFSLEYTTWQVVAASVSLGMVLTALLIFIRRVWPLKVKASEDASELGDDPERMLPAAVIVYSKDEAGDLARLIPELMEQQYEPGFDVIVVNEGHSPAVVELINDLKLQHPNLYLTGTPDGARSLSRKKLAITLGIKATRKPVVILTTAEARPSGPNWLHAMMRNFDPDGPVEVVLGYATPPAGDPAGSSTRWFDIVAVASRWISPAILGHPWRGTEHNLAYRTDVFFRNKGFSKHLNLRHGDDDIFVSEIAKPYNTVVDLSPEARVYVPGGCDRRTVRGNAIRRAFTERFIKHRPRLMGSIGTLAYMLAPLCAIAVGGVAPQNWGAWALTAILLVVWYATGMVWLPAFKALDARRPGATLPLAAATYPLRQFYRRAMAIMRHGKRYTWE